MLYFSKWVARAALVVSTMVVSAGASAQVTWSIADGKVTGAQNVNVGGSFYDVTFGLSYVPTAGFVNSTFATLASQALVDQVFTAEAPLNLDNSASSMRGCGYERSCSVWTIYGDSAFSQDDPWGVRFIGFSIARNESPANGSDWAYDRTGHYLVPRTFPAMDYSVYATWSSAPVTAVPEPETYALMLAGLGLIGAVARRRKAKQA